MRKKMFLLNCLTKRREVFSDHQSKQPPPPETLSFEKLTYQTEETIGSRAKVSVVLLASDYTLEHEFRRMIALPGVDFYHSLAWHCLRLA